MRSRARGWLAISVLAVTPFSAASAQTEGWIAEASAGRFTHGPDVLQVDHFGASLAVRHEGPRWLYASGGLPIDGEGVLWGALGLGGRLASDGELGYGLDAAGHAFGFRDRVGNATGGGIVVEAMPLVFGGVGPVRVELRSGLLHYSRTYELNETETYTGESFSRNVHQTDLRVLLPLDVVTLTTETRFLRATEGNYPYLGAAAEAPVGPGWVWGYAGRWLSGEVEDPVWGAGIRLRAAARTQVFASVQQETNDPLYWNHPRRTWTAGVSMRMGSVSRAGPPPGQPLAAAGLVTFQLPRSSFERQPLLAGEFTGWRALPMSPSGEYWAISVPLESGVYRYSFVDEQGRWFVPEWVAGRVQDGMGGTSAVLVVPS